MVSVSMGLFSTYNVDFQSKVVKDFIVITSNHVRLDLKAA